MFEYKSDTVFSIQDFQDMIHPQDHEKVKRLFISYAQGEQDFFESDMRILDAHNEYKWVLSYAKILERDDQDNPSVVAGCHMDISDLKYRTIQNKLLIDQLNEKEEKIDMLGKIISICSICKKVKVDEENWAQFEQFVSQEFNYRMSHTICEECALKEYPSIYEQKKEQSNQVILSVDPNKILFDYSHSSFQFQNSELEKRIIEDNSIKYIVLDLLKVEYIDSSGVSNLILLNECVKRHGKYLELKNVNQNILKIFKITKIGKLLKYSDETEDQFYARSSLK